MSQRIKRIVPRDDKVLLAHYADLMATQPPDAVVIEDDSGIYRWKANDFSLEDYMEFYRGMGYSLSGFIEIFGDKLWPEKEES